MKVVRKYTQLLETHPLKTRMITAGTMFLTADLICQKCIEKKEKVLWNRTRDNGIIGGIVIAPILHLWINFAQQRILKVYLPKMGFLVNASNKKFAIAAVILDQMVLAAPMQLLYFMSSSYLTYGSFEVGLTVAKKQLPDSFVNSAKIWPFTNFINYCYVPLAYRVLCNNFVGVFWQIYMSYKSHNYNIDLSQKFLASANFDSTQMSSSPSPSSKSI